MPQVTVVMPMRNGRPYVEQALRSILDQRGVDLEIVVVDDGSTDGSAEGIADLNDPRIRVIPGPEKGISAAVNAGIEHAQGEFIARSDADDIYPAGRLARQVQFLVEHEEFGVICGAFHSVTHKGHPIALLGNYTGSEDITEELNAGKTRTHFCTFLTRAALLRQLGGCREFFVTGEDVDLQFRLGESARVWYEHQNCYFYRLHQNSIIHSQADVERAFYEECAKRFLKQRMANEKDDLESGNAPSPPKDAPSAPKSVAAQIQGHLSGACWRAFTRGEFRDAYRFALRQCRFFPCALTSWRTLIVLVCKTLVGRPQPER